MNVKIELIPDPKFPYEEGIVKLIDQWQNGFGENVTFIETDLPVINIRLFARDFGFADHFGLLHYDTYLEDHIFLGAWIDIVLIKDDSIDIYKLKDFIESSINDIAAAIIIDNTLKKKIEHNVILNSIAFKKIKVYSSNDAFDYLLKKYDFKFPVTGQELEHDCLKITYLGIFLESIDWYIEEKKVYSSNGSEIQDITLLKKIGTIPMFPETKVESNENNSPPIVPDQKIGIYYDFQIESLIQEFKEFLEARLMDSKVDSRLILIPTDFKECNKVFIIMALDEAKDDKALEIIEICKANQIQFYIVLPDENYRPTKSQINSKKLGLIEDKHSELKQKYPANIISYSVKEDIIEKLIQKIKVYNPKINIRKLEISNIGHFRNAVLEFDDRFTCIHGLNGTGKTTILRAIAVGLIGIKNHKEVDLQKITGELLRITKINEGYPLRENGSIALEFSIDNKIYKNKISLKQTEMGEIEIEEEIQNEIKYGELYLKSLIIGFAQSRAEDNNGETSLIRKISPANMRDIIPLINNKFKNKLSNFSIWISDLDAEANKKEKNLESGEVVKERKLILDSFKLFSEIASMEVHFLNVFKQSTHDVWVSTGTSEAISIKMLSQGFQSILEWVGYFMQRMSEAYPDSTDFTKENAVCFVDEIDTYLHPIFQGNIVKILKEWFPNTQFIITSHSPLVIGNLTTEQVIQIEYDKKNNSLSCKHPEINPYGATVDRILKMIMDSDTRNSEIKKLLTEYIDHIEEDELEEAEKSRNILVNDKKVDSFDPEIVKGDLMMDLKKRRKKS